MNVQHAGSFATGVGPGALFPGYMSGFGNGFESLCAVRSGRVNDLVVHAPEFFSPLKIKLFGVSFCGEIVLAEDQDEGGGRFREDFGHVMF